MKTYPLQINGENYKVGGPGDIMASPPSARGFTLKVYEKGTGEYATIFKGTEPNGFAFLIYNDGENNILLKGKGADHLQDLYSNSVLLKNIRQKKYFDQDNMEFLRKTCLSGRIWELKINNTVYFFIAIWNIAITPLQYETLKQILNKLPADRTYIQMGMAGKSSSSRFSPVTNFTPNFSVSQDKSKLTKKEKEYVQQAHMNVPQLPAAYAKELKRLKSMTECDRLSANTFLKLSTKLWENRKEELGINPIKMTHNYCPRCKSDMFTLISTEPRWKCNNCNYQWGKIHGRVGMFEISIFMQLASEEEKLQFNEYMKNGNISGIKSLLLKVTGYDVSELTEVLFENVFKKLKGLTLASLLALSPLYTSAAVYTIKSGDNLTKISKTYDIPVKDIVKLNKLDDPNKISVGQKLIIPDKSDKKPSVSKSSMKITNDFIKYMKNVENGQKKGLRGGKWYQHKSYEKGNDTIAYGHKLTDYEQNNGSYRDGLTQSEADRLLMKDINIAIKKAENQLLKFNTFPQYVQEAIVNAFFRGDIGPKTKKLINAGDWKNVPDEYLDHKNYKDPEGSVGVKQRMKKNSQAFVKYAKELGMMEEYFGFNYYF